MTGRLIQASLCGGVAWFAYQLANQVASSGHALEEAPAPAIALLALTLTVAAYVAMRRQAGLQQRTPAPSAHCRAAEIEMAGLVGAIEESSDAIVIIRADGTIQCVNPAYTRMTGYSAGEVVGHHPCRAQPGLGPAFHDRVRDTVQAGKVWRGEVANRRKNGSLYVEEMSVAPVRDARGVIRKYIAIRRDMTAQIGG